MAGAPLARVVRSGLEESVHVGHVAVCDVDGRVVAAAGDPRHVCYLRSCAKPIQAAVSLSAIDRPLPDGLVAVMSASHNGEAVHRRAVRAVLRAAHLDASALRTPPGLPLDAEAARRVRAPSPLSHNCSGKHAGMLLACVRQGWPTATYRRASHPLQRRVTDAVVLSADVVPTIGVDGCGVPVHGMPLSAIATAYARLAAPDRFDGLSQAVGRVTSAMRAAPYLVGGGGRTDTTLMTAVDDLIVKEGAEALTCGVHLGAGLGIAVKIADGGERAVGPAFVAALSQLGLLTPPARAAIRGVAERPVVGGGRPVGAVEPLLRLRGRAVAP
ncbi:MAG TPA: asparaginase [Actinomycetota bacterium]|nr:asparaginase [Actinomycetota bacterium]